MKDIFLKILQGLESRWPGSNVDIVTYNSGEIYFITLAGYDNRFVQLLLKPDQIEVIAEVIDLGNPDSNIFEVMEIVENEEGKFIFRRAEGGGFEVNDFFRIIDQIDISLNQLSAAFPNS